MHGNYLFRMEETPFRVLKVVVFVSNSRREVVQLKNQPHGIMRNCQVELFS